MILMDGTCSPPIGRVPGSQIKGIIMTITIKTKIDNRCSDAGVHTEAEYATGPRNLLRAIDEINDIRRRKTQAYGNIGHNRTWIEVDGVQLRQWDEESLDADNVAAEIADYERQGLYRARPEARTTRAKNMINSVRSGELVADRARAAAELDQHNV